MRKWLSAAAILAALIHAGAALADTPAQVYSDFAEDGVLSCGHSRAALNGSLSDASLQQYGDPYTLLGLKLAVRKQLAGGCRRGERSGTLFGSAGGDGTGSAAGEERASRSAKASPTQRARERGSGEDDPSSSPLTNGGAALDTAGETQDGRMVFLGVVLLLLTLGSGGWAAKRAYTDHE